MSSESSFNKDSVQGTVVIAAVLCLVCSLAVSGLAVGLREKIDLNKELYLKENVLRACGRVAGDAPSPDADEISRKFEGIEAYFVVLPGLKDEEAGSIKAGLPANYEPRKAAKDAELGVEIAPENDIAKIHRREKYGRVYIVPASGETPRQVVVPINGKGLWSTLYGFMSLSLEPAATGGESQWVIQGITFYEHAETPGLGGEVENLKWQSGWRGKVPYDGKGVAQIDVIKGSVKPSDSGSEHKVDGLSGATITSVGVKNLVNYWLGTDGYGPFLDKLQGSEIPELAK
ncbi:MAG: Na(+)-translocating NADH-quinone reductase subunit C [Planctomycetaceae bacterium]